MARAADGHHALQPLRTAGEAATTSMTLTTRRSSHVATPRRNHNDAQRAPSALSGFVAVSRECAQTSWALIAKNARFSAEYVEGGGLNNRRLRQCKISICEVVISVTLSVRGEVAERLKAAVC
jgi:hypothetical protein